MFVYWDGYPRFSFSAIHFPDFLANIIVPIALPPLYTFPYSLLIPKKASTILPFLWYPDSITLIFSFELTFLNIFLAIDQSPSHSIRSKFPKFKVFNEYFEIDILNDLLFLVINSFIHLIAVSLFPFSMAKLLELASNDTHPTIYL